MHTVICETCGKTSKKHKPGRYCSPQCAKVSARKDDITLTCAGCNCSFSVRPNHHRRKYCTHDCYLQAKTGKPAVHASMVICEHCGKNFKLTPNKIERSEHLYCSSECMGQATRIALPISAGELTERYITKQESLQSLAIEFGVSEWVIKRILTENDVPLRGRGQWSKASWEEATPERFAAVSKVGKRNIVLAMAKSDPVAAALAGQIKRGPTSIEKLFMGALDRRQIEYVFQFSVGGKFLCDFYLPAQNTIVECDGIYWHSKPSAIIRDKSKDAYLRKCGYKVIRFTDKEINKQLAHCVDLALSL